MTKKCLITGVSGFVGQHLTSILLEKGHTVYGFDRSSKDIPEVNQKKIDILDQKAVEELILEIKPDYIFHLAAQSSVKSSWDNPEQTKAVNVQGTKNIFDAILTANISDSCKILVVSSAEIYGVPKEDLIKETDQLNPVNPYGESRLEQEQLIEEYLKKGLNIVITRSFPHTGPLQLPIFVCSSFAQQVALIESGKQEPILDVGNLSAVRDFSDVRDVVKAYCTLLFEDKKGVFNVCSGKGVSIEDILKMLVEMSGTEIKVQVNPDKFRPNDIPSLVGDNSLIVKETGWKPEIELKNTLTDLLNYWRKNI
jgi:GDP-4-dehydro-6-deoxy-D-mannose reductase